MVDMYEHNLEIIRVEPRNLISAGSLVVRSKGIYKVARVPLINQVNNFGLEFAPMTLEHFAQFVTRVAFRTLPECRSGVGGVQFWLPAAAGPVS